MPELVVISTDDLRNLIREEVNAALSVHRSSPTPDLLTVKEACKKFKTSRTTIHRLREAGKITNKGRGRKILFSNSELSRALSLEPAA